MNCIFDYLGWKYEVHIRDRAILFSRNLSKHETSLESMSNEKMAPCCMLESPSELLKNTNTSTDNQKIWQNPLWYGLDFGTLRNSPELHPLL